ncbi:MAG TPA: hypothetical protein VF914_13425 [Chloroflexia bacterium]|jgi:hypothetical protein
MPAPDFDACQYLSTAEVEAATSQRFTAGTGSPEKKEASCIYTGDGEYILLTVYKGRDEAEAASLLSGLMSNGQPLTGLGDAATVVTSETPGSALNNLVGVKAGNVYFVVRWLSNREESVIEALKTMARTVLSHLDSQ